MALSKLKKKLLMFLVPDFDPIEAYSMSIDESTSLSLNLTPTNLQESFYTKHLEYSLKRL